MMFTALRTGFSFVRTTEFSKPKGSGVPGRVIEFPPRSISVTVKAKDTELAEIESHVGPLRVPLVICAGSMQL